VPFWLAEPPVEPAFDLTRQHDACPTASWGLPEPHGWRLKGGLSMDCTTRRRAALRLAGVDRRARLLDAEAGW
jgi:hypothetical protein